MSLLPCSLQRTYGYLSLEFLSCPITSFSTPREADGLAGLGTALRAQQVLEKQAETQIL